MKLADLSTGPDWVVYVGFIIFAVLSIVLISGHGSWLISGYNTASKEEKAKYNEKKLCRTMGIGMSVIAILLLIMGVFENILPAFFVYIALGIILADVVIIIVLGNTICRRWQNPVCRIQKFNMKYEIERMEIIYTFYFFLPFWKKWLKNYWHFVTGRTSQSVGRIQTGSI